MNRSSPRTCFMLLAAAGIALAGQPAAAKDTPKGNFTKDGAEGYCNAKEGSTFWASPDGMNYGCGYKGGGGLMCDKQTGCIESDGQLEEGQERRPPWGWAGLLGLAGLIGLMRRDRRDADPVR